MDNVGTVFAFTSEALDAMCKRRPGGYREDVLAISREKPGEPGVYEIDVSTPEYTALLKKYRKLVMTRAGLDAHKTVPIGVAMMSMGRYKDGGKAVAVKSDVFMERLPRIVEILGHGSRLGALYADMQAKVRTGKCGGCALGRMRASLMQAFKLALAAVPVETRRELRALFPESEYVEIVPKMLKWDEVIGDGQKQEHDHNSGGPA